jgi:hypothetical protein
VFGQKSNEIVLSKSYLNNPILLANPKIMEGLEQLVQKALHRAYALNSWREKVAQILFKDNCPTSRDDNPQPSA